MTLSTKIVIAISTILIICFATFIIYKQIEISKKQQDIETQIIKQKDLVDNITRSMNEYASKDDIEQFIKNNNVNLQAIQDDMKKLHAEISAVNVIKISSNGYQGTNIPSTHTGSDNPNPPNTTIDCNGQQISCPNIDPNEYFKRRQDLTLFEPFGTIKVPLGEVGFSAWQNKPWTVDIFPRTYHVTSVVGTDENQRQYFYNKFTVSVDGKNYDLKIDSATTKQEYPEAKFSWWNPRLFLTAGSGLNLTESSIKPNVNAGITFGFMSYGRFKNNPIINLLQVGVGYESENGLPIAIINPINFNICGILSNGLINNTYVGPSLQMNAIGDIFFGGNLSVGF